MSLFVSKETPLARARTSRGASFPNNSDNPGPSRVSQLVTFLCTLRLVSRICSAAPSPAAFAVLWAFLPLVPTRCATVGDQLHPDRSAALERRQCRQRRTLSVSGLRRPSRLAHTRQGLEADLIPTVKKGHEHSIVEPPLPLLRIGRPPQKRRRHCSPSHDEVRQRWQRDTRAPAQTRGAL